MIIEIKEDLEEFRIDSFLSDYFEDYSRSKLAKIIKKGLVTVNNKVVKPSYQLKMNDYINIDLKDLELKEIQKEDIYIEVIYEDDDIAIINKPSGIISHPTASIRTNTLVNALMNRFDKLSKINGEDRQGIVHRLDYNTCGLMIIAKNDEAAISLIQMFKDRTIIKRYRAITIGNFDQDEGILEFPIARSKTNRKLMEVNDQGRYAKTGYKVIYQSKGYSYLDISLFTGRTHQIRVHLSHINRPILGDIDYGGKKSEFAINYQLLQAFYLEFNHPITKKHLKFEIDESSEIKKYADLLFKEQRCIQVQKQ